MGPSRLLHPRRSRHKIPQIPRPRPLSRSRRRRLRAPRRVEVVVELTPVCLNRARRSGAVRHQLVTDSPRVLDLCTGSGILAITAALLLGLDRPPEQGEQEQRAEQPEPPGEGVGMTAVGSHGSNRYAAKARLTRRAVTAAIPSIERPLQGIRAHGYRHGRAAPLHLRHHQAGPRPRPAGPARPGTPCAGCGRWHGRPRCRVGRAATSPPQEPP